MSISSPDIHWEDEKINRWNFKNRSLPSSITKFYEDTKLGYQPQLEPRRSISTTLFAHCIPDCQSCDGYIVIAESGHRYQCGCIHHNLLDSGSI